MLDGAVRATIFSLLCLLMPVLSHAVTLSGTVVDADTNAVLPCRVHIEGPDATYYAPAGHSTTVDWQTINVLHPLNNEPDISNRGEHWAMLEGGTFSVELPAVNGIRVRIEHGLEYERKTATVDLAGLSGTVQRTFTLKRGINMRARGWMSGDTHVHSLTPQGAVRQMKVEALDYVNLMFMGPGNDLWQQGHFIAAPAPESTPDQIVYVSQEVRDNQQGHLTTLNMKHQLTPLMAHTGDPQIAGWPIYPNEPLNWDVYDLLHAEDTLVFAAHYIYYPGYTSHVCAALGKLDGVEMNQADMKFAGTYTFMELPVPGYPQTGAAKMWYYMLNCGLRVPLCAGTDKMAINPAVGGTTRTYAKVDAFSHDGFIEGLRRGATFATNGPLLDFTVNGEGIGSELVANGLGVTLPLHIEGSCHTEKPISYIEVIRNGSVIHTQNVGSNVKDVTISLDLEVDQSCWLALRAGGTQYQTTNWSGHITAAHTSPVYVTINGKRPAEKASAEYLLARSQAALNWSNSLIALYSTEANRQRAAVGYEQAVAFYTDTIERNRRATLHPADVDFDEDIDAADIQKVINAALGMLPPDEYDIDHDGDVNALDVQLAINAALGLW